MKNLDQIRANNALIAARGKEGTQFKILRSDIAGFPALIIQNGLLAAFAYATEEKRPKRAGLKFACDRTASHLSRRGIPVLEDKDTAVALIRALSEGSATSLDLQRATSEALAFFGYLKRFAAAEQPK